MSTTLATARTRLRSMLRETTANQWSNTRIDQLIQDADHWNVTDTGLVRNTGGYIEAQEEITLSASATTFSLTTGTPPTALTYDLEAIVCIEHQGASGLWSLCDELPEAEEFRYRAQNAISATGDVPPLYRLRRPNIVFLPAAAAARTLKVTYRRAPTALSADGTNLNSPDIDVPLVCTRAAIFALADLGESETNFDGSYQTLLDEKYRRLGHPQGEGRASLVKDVESHALFNF